jgi:hypothetical protein
MLRGRITVSLPLAVAQRVPQVGRDTTPPTPHYDATPSATGVISLGLRRRMFGGQFLNVNFPDRHAFNLLPQVLA